MTTDAAPLPELQLDGLTADPDRLARLLGMPSPAAFDDRTYRLIQSIQRWCLSHARPEHATHMLAIESVTSDRVVMSDGRSLRAGPYFLKQLRQNNADALAVVALTLGPALTSRATRLWEEDRLDESHLLNVYGAALIEQHSESAGRQLCVWASTRGWFVLPRQAPGYNDWPTEHLADLYRVVAHGDESSLRGLRLHEGASLAPVHSLLFAHGLTRDAQAAHQLTTSHNPCHVCSLPSCSYRRTSISAGASFQAAPDLSVMGASRP